jgi:hypothetical protein
MDYFSELLESYGKLKKRTFKLTYINEAEEKKGDDLSQYIDQAKQAFDAALKGEDQIGVGQKQNINFEYRDPSEFGQPSVKVSGSNLGDKIYTANDWSGLNWKSKQSKGYKILAAWGGGGDEGSDDTDVDDAATTRAEQAAQAELDAQQAEQERLAKLEQLGGAFELAGRNPEDLKVILQNLRQSEKSLKEFCSNLDPQTKEGSMKSLCARPGAYLAGASTAGFEYKLSKGQVIQTDENGKQIGTGPLETGLLQAVTESHTALTDFLNGKGDCETIQSKIGWFRDKLVLFGDTTEEGVTIKPNALQDSAIQMMNRQCGDPDLKFIIDDKLSPNEINAVKGTFNELTLQLGIRIVAAKTDKERREAFSEVAAEIEKRREFLTAYAATQETKPDVALGLDESFDNEVLLEQAGIAQDNTALREWFLNEVSMQLDFVRAVNADGVIPAGKDVITGDRADTKLLYNDEAKAKKAAKLIGSSVKKTENGFEVGVGQKRLKELKSTKIGEINNTERMTQIFDESVDSDQNLAPGFSNRIRTMQFAGDEARYEAAQTFYKGVEEKIKKSTRSLTDYATYIDSNGKIRSVKPESRLKTIADSIKGLLGYDALKNSSLGKALFKGDANYRDFEDTATQQRASEVVQREARFKAMKDAIEDPNNPDNQAARDTLVRMTLICGANKEAMSQLITDDSGESYVIAHNEALERIAKANTDGTLTVSIEGTTATMTTADGISVTFNQEGSWGGGQRRTRSNTRLPKSTIEALNKNLKLTKEDTLHKFLQGQMQLLETLLS